MKTTYVLLLMFIFLVGCASSDIQISSTIPQGQNIKILIETTDREE